MATAEALLTAEEYYLLPDDGQPTELVRGRVVPVNMPSPSHEEAARPAGDSVAPDLVFEVRSSTDNWLQVYKRVAGYFKAGVKAVGVLDPPSGATFVYFADQPPRIARPTRRRIWFSGEELRVEG